MRGKRLLISGALIAAAVAAGALSLRRRPAPPPPPHAASQPVQDRDLVLTGRVRARQVVGVGAAVTGVVEAFFADVGQEVEEGQTLARVANQGLETSRELATLAADNAQSRVTRIEAAITSARLESSRAAADAARAREEFERADRTYRRQKVLHGEGATPRRTYEKSADEFAAAQSEHDGLSKLAKQADARIQTLLDDLRAARKTLDEKQKALDDAVSAIAEGEIHSPVDGIVVARKGEVGKPAGEQGADLFQIATDILQLEVLLEPDPGQLKRIRAGQPALVIVSDLRAEGIAGKVSRVQEDGNVLVEFTSPDPAIKPGMVADVRIPAN